MTTQCVMCGKAGYVWLETHSGFNELVWFLDKKFDDLFMKSKSFVVDGEIRTGVFKFKKEYYKMKSDRALQKISEHDYNMYNQTGYGFFSQRQPYLHGDVLIVTTKFGVNIWQKVLMHVSNTKSTTISINIIENKYDILHQTIGSVDSKMWDPSVTIITGEMFNAIMKAYDVMPSLIAVKAWITQGHDKKDQRFKRYNAKFVESDVCMAVHKRTLMPGPKSKSLVYYEHKTDTPDVVMNETVTNKDGSEVLFKEPVHALLDRYLFHWGHVVINHPSVHFRKPESNVFVHSDPYMYETKMECIKMSPPKQERKRIFSVVNATLGEPLSSKLCEVYHRYTVQHLLRSSLKTRDKDEPDEGVRNKMTLQLWKPMKQKLVTVDMMCSICYDSISTELSFPCGHRACLECALAWFEASSKFNLERSRDVMARWHYELQRTSVRCHLCRKSFCVREAKVFSIQTDLSKRCVVSQSHTSKHVHGSKVRRLDGLDELESKEDIKKPSKQSVKEVVPVRPKSVTLDKFRKVHVLVNANISRKTHTIVMSNFQNTCDDVCYYLRENGVCVRGLSTKQTYSNRKKMVSQFCDSSEASVLVFPYKFCCQGFVSHVDAHIVLFDIFQNEDQRNKCLQALRSRSEHFVQEITQLVWSDTPEETLYYKMDY